MTELPRGQSLYPGDSIWSTDVGSGITFQLILQTDGNLVEYKHVAGVSGAGVCWATGTNGSGATNATYQTDGNFVLYNGNWALWSSNTKGQPGNTVDISSNGVMWVGQTMKLSVC
ncbi:hypothetical protein E6W39_12650 [Kitasatospora acidiphila]|uniref:Bulb-type lectin domain-containing protein n=2 Tax=Kitasatospora acidiphila TaxID=2567942 RepID=A0A540WEB3_9ACTN|nr:hypothetical protein E6W39_12650 [Kitasatospora acidiphila]